MFEVRHPSRNRLYTRSFDWNEAARLREEGLTYAAIAERLGVSNEAVRYALSADVRARNDANKRRQRTGVCEVCAGPAMKLIGSKALHNQDGRVLCNRCRSREKRERIRLDEHGRIEAVRCGTCKRWLPLGVFTAGPRYRDLRPKGISVRCRDCMTAARQDYRERHKIPCLNCGRPRLPANEKGRQRDTGLCRTCYQEGSHA